MVCLDSDAFNRKINCRYFSYDDSGLCCILSGPCRRYKYFRSSEHKVPILRICKPVLKKYIKPCVWINLSLF